MSNNWWMTSDGEDVTKDVKQEYDTGGGSFEPIPDKTNALATIITAAWAKSRDNDRYVNIQWSITKPEEYARRIVFMKVWCGDLDPRAKDPEKKRDKAKKMLITIDGLAGGKLAKAGREPDDDDLALALTNKSMGVTIMLWEMDGEDGKPMSGNWISSVWAKGAKELTVPPKAAPKTGGGGSQARRRPDPIDDDDDDSGIPF